MSGRNAHGCEMHSELSMQQKEGESLQDYTKRLKVAKEVLESHLGVLVRQISQTKSLPFCKTSFCLYAYNPFEEVKDYQLITTIEENRKVYTEKQLQRAKKARE
jgi:hypothetical protein